MLASDRFWTDAARGAVTIALPATLEGSDGDMLVGLTLNPEPAAFAALHAADPEVRVRTLVNAMQTAGRVVEFKYPQVKVFR